MIKKKNLLDIIRNSEGINKVKILRIMGALGALGVSIYLIIKKFSVYYLGFVIISLILLFFSLKKKKEINETQTISEKQSNSSVPQEFVDEDERGEAIKKENNNFPNWNGDVV